MGRGRGAWPGGFIGWVVIGALAGLAAQVVCRVLSATWGYRRELAAAFPLVIGGLWQVTGRPFDLPPGYLVPWRPSKSLPLAVGTRVHFGKIEGEFRP